MDESAIHHPVLMREVLDFFNLNRGDSVIDATANGGGHLSAFAERVLPEGYLIGFEWDPEIYEHLKNKVRDSKNILLLNENYVNMLNLFPGGYPKPDAIFFDFGISSWHVDSSLRGFTFKQDQPLDMRFNPEGYRKTAAEILNTYSLIDLTKIFREFGEEQEAFNIAKGIVKERTQRTITTTYDLLEIINKYKPYGGYKKIHKATKIFQALRIAVNDELENVFKGLENAISLLSSGGKLCVISFHSLEDRIVKNIFKKAFQEGIAKSISKKPIIPNEAEMLINKRSRSAKMRYLIKV